MHGAAVIPFLIQSCSAVFFSTFLAKCASLLALIYPVFDSFCKAGIVRMESVEIMLPCRREHDFDDFAPSIFAHVWYFFPLVVFMFSGGAFLLGRRFLWSLLASLLLIWGCHGVPLGRSFASMLYLLCLLVPVRTSWSASTRESFPNGHKTGSRWN